VGSIAIAEPAAGDREAGQIGNGNRAVDRTA
jgi:hypothetical protein